MTQTKKKDFVELKYTGTSNGNVFDSNILEDLKKINPQAKPQKTIVVIGEGMVVPGLDKALENKETEKEYEIKLAPKEGFGERDRNLLKTIPLKVFTEREIHPRPGMMLELDNNIAKIVSISGARVMTDFNNPLAGKEVDYKFKIVRILNDEKEMTESLLESLFRFKPEFDIIENEIIIKGQKGFEIFVNAFKDKVKELLSKELKFQLMEKKKENLEKTEEKKENKIEEKKE